MICLALSIFITEMFLSDSVFQWNAFTCALPKSRGMSLSLTVKHLEHSPVSFLFWILLPAIEVCCPISLITYEVTKSFRKFHHLLCQTVTFWEIKWNAGPIRLFSFPLKRTDKTPTTSFQVFHQQIIKLFYCADYTQILVYIGISCLNLKS